MKILLRIVQVLYVVYAFLLFIVFMLIVFLLVVGAAFFGPVSGGTFIYRVCGYWADIWLPLIGVRAKNIYASPHDRNRQYIFVINHISYMDVPMVVKAIRQPIRVLAKQEMSRIPVFGFLYRNAAIMVDRSSRESRARSIAVLKEALHRGISVVIFPEGTFNHTGQALKSFYDGAFRIAIETQTPIKPVIFPDTYNRLHYRSIFSLTPGICRAVYLEEVSVEGMTNKELVQLKDRVYTLMESAIQAYRNNP